MIRVQVVFGGVGAQPADGGFAVLNLGGEDGVLAQAVIDRGHGVTPGQIVQGRPHFLAAASPGAAMDIDNQRQVLAVLRQIQVELLARVPIGHISQVPIGRGALRHSGRPDRRPAAANRPRRPARPAWAAAGCSCSRG